ncbi:MAG: hypothetical protein JW984_01900 [Deltaproteobacteria bacterium]|uniref:Uncharacterized protein n=1 Tax=Candidatus Zymogenus saltonus TaxID=2844893 RepID=A0A9D8K9Z3_9DELT|nr:hypothetical protein [Candidatus Zymogenus saltonus]
MLFLNDTKFVARRKFFALAGQVYVNDGAGGLVCYVRQKMFKLKEDITVYSDESQTMPILNIKARQIIDFAAAYDIVDSATGAKMGALKRKGLKSIIKDEWIIMDSTDNNIAVLKEESGLMAILSRLINLIPQRYVILMGGSGQVVGTIRQRFNIFIHKFDIDFSMDPGASLDRRLGMGAAILLLIIEGQQG